MKYNRPVSDRRKFFKLAGQSTVAVAGILLSKDLFSQAAKKPVPTTLVSLDDPVAKALGYVHDRKNADKEKFGAVLKANPTAVCKTCQHYTEVKGGQGTCVPIPSGLVKAEGWCSAWVKKEA